MKKLIALQFARKRKRATDYRKRLKLILSGSPRLVVRKTSQQIIVQITKFDKKGDEVVASAGSGMLRKHGWQMAVKNIPAAYLTGLIAGKAALSKGVKSAVVDAGIGKPSPKGRIYAALKGAVDAGLNVKADSDVFPIPERISGSHISKYVNASSGGQFSLYKKNGLSSEKISESFKAVKSKIEGQNA